jgi:hypothetical protein
VEVVETDRSMMAFDLRALDAAGRAVVVVIRRL